MEKSNANENGDELSKNDIKLEIEPGDQKEIVHPPQYSTIAVYDNPAFNTQDLPVESNKNSYNLNSVPSAPVMEEIGPFEKIVSKAQSLVLNFWKSHEKILKKVFLCLLLVAFYIYLGFAIYYDFYRNDSWCHGSRFLLLLTILVHLTVFYYLIVKKLWVRLVPKSYIKYLGFVYNRALSHWIIRSVIVCGIIVAIVVFLIVDSIGDSGRLVSASGILVLIICGFVFSINPSKVKWRPVLWGLFLQFILALIILRWNFGKELFKCVGDKVKSFLEFTDVGSSFVFGFLVNGKLKSPKSIKLPEQFPTFAFKVLPVIIFFNACTAILYYLGVMQVLVKKVGWMLKITVGTTVGESMNAAGNIFLGMTEAPLLIAPLLPKMTNSEIHSVMTGGFATIAGSIMAAYINFGIKASHLLSASVMSAPAALGISKLFYPETKQSETELGSIDAGKIEDRNMLEAVARGSSQSIKLVANIVVNLIAFLAFIAFIDNILAWIGGMVNYPELSFENILSKIFVPLALVMGVEWNDAQKVAGLIGLKTIANEFVAYARLGEMIEEGSLSPRSEAIATYALCGFSNIGSIGIQLGALGALAPSKKATMAKVGFRAMISGSVACFLTACVAGTLIPSSELQLTQSANYIAESVNDTLSGI